MFKIKIIISLFFLLFVSFAEAQSIENRADSILKSSGRIDGLCVLVNISDPELAVAIAKKSKFVIHIVHKDLNTVLSMRKYIDDHGLYGRVSVNRISSSGKSLPYAENLINLLVVEKSDLSPFLRVLAPYGVALVDGKKIAKPFPEEMDEWTHFRHNAEGNMVAQDSIVGPPRHARWVTGPQFQRAHTLTPGTSTMVAARGRLFYIQDESPVSFAGIPGKWVLIARDAFNGKLLWKLPMKEWGDEVWSWWSGGHGARDNHPDHIVKRLVASDKLLFATLGYNAPVSALDPATGKILHVYKGTEFTDEIVFRKRVLYLSVNDRAQKPLPGIGFNSKPTKDNTSKKTIWAIDTASHKVLWKSGTYTGISGKKNRMSSMKTVLLMASEKGVFINDNNSLIRLDLKTGKELFNITLKVPGKTAVVYYKGMLLIGYKGKLHCYNAENGKSIWSAEFKSLDNK